MVSVIEPVSSEVSGAWRGPAPLPSAGARIRYAVGMRRREKQHTRVPRMDVREKRQAGVQNGTSMRTGKADGTKR